MAAGGPPQARLNPPQRTLFGPDLSNPSPRAVQGLIASLEGAADPDFRKVLDLAARLARRLFQGESAAVVLVPGSEEAGAEAALLNLVPAGGAVVVASCGYYGDRLADTARRLGLAVSVAEGGWGRPVPVEAVRRALDAHRPAALFVVHGEGSTGVEQPLAPLGALCRERSVLFCVDATFTLGGVEVAVDERGIDACWAGSGKALSALPGVVLMALSARAQRAIDGFPRRTRYFDLGLALRGEAWETLPAPLVYALVEVLQLSAEQGPAYRFGRHRNRRDALVAGLEAMGLEVFAAPDARLDTVTAVRVPAGIDGERVREQLLRRYRVEIGGGLGATAGQVWRVAIMAHSATPVNLVTFLTCLELLLEEQGRTAARGEGVRAALQVLELS